MPVFADGVGLDGRLLWWGLEVCTAGDDFATVQYRWANMAADVGGNHYQERIASLGNIHRGLGNDHLPVASTVELVLDNTDAGADFLVNRATVESSVFRARFRLWVGIDDDTPNTYQSTIVTQQVGVFVCLDFPERNAASIRLSLTDDSLGKLNDLVLAPTLADWRADAGNTADNAPFSTTITRNEVAALTDFDAPLPLQFGQPPYIGVPACTWRTAPVPANFDLANWPAGQRVNLFPIIVLATRSAATLGTDDVKLIRGVYREELSQDLEGTEWAGRTLAIPETYQAPSGVVRLWKSYKTQTITKGGYAWKLLWISFNATAYAQWFNETQIPPGKRVVYGWIGVPARWNRTNGDGLSPQGNVFAAFDRFVISGFPGSGVQGTALDTYRNPANVMFDLVESYSVMGAGAVDTTRFTRARNAMRMDVRGSVSFEGSDAGGISKTFVGERDPGVYGLGQLRKAIADLARTADLDVWLTSDGKVGVAVMAADFETKTTTYTTIDEARIGNVSDTIPSQGQRWAPYNRVFLKCPDGRVRGPFDDAVAIAAWGGKIISRTLDCKWWAHNIVRTFAGGASASDLPTVKNFRFIEAKARPRISFTTDVGILVLELADYFMMSWTRGGEATVYASTLWRLESVTISPKNGAVDVTAIWMGDIQSTQPFLLDTESLVIRTTPAGAQTLTVTTGSTTVTRSAGSFIADGVAGGDVVRMRDTTEAATAFTRNRDVKVVSVTDALNLVVADSAFGSAGAHVITVNDWRVFRSFLTYPDVISDPTNYPSGGLMYGKICNSVGRFSDDTLANELLDG